MSRRHPHQKSEEKISLETAAPPVEAAAPKEEKKEEPLPRLPAFDRKKFWSINWKALPADLSFIAFGIVLSQGYFSDNHVLSTLTPKTILLFYSGVVIVVSWYIGFMLSRYKVYYDNAVNKVARWIFAIAGITLLGYLMATINSLMYGGEKPDADGEHFAMIATFLLVLGPLFGIGGYMTGIQEIRSSLGGNRKREENSKEPSPDEQFYVVVIALLIAIVFLVKCSMSDFVQHSSVSILWFILIFLGAGLVAALGIGAMMVVKWLLVKIGLYYNLVFIFETVFPCVVISSLIFWNELQRHYFSGLSAHAFLGVLFFTGILPFRVALIFNPPLRAINLFVGIASFLFYVWSMH